MVYDQTLMCDIPVWSHALCWYVTGEGSCDHLPPDFGLEQDWQSACMFLTPSKQPFVWAPDLWDRIRERRDRMIVMSPVFIDWQQDMSPVSEEEPESSHPPVAAGILSEDR